MNEAVYVQIAPDTASVDNDNDKSNTDCQLYAWCGLIVVSTSFVAALGLYFLITEH
jgi:hypothetical protein